MMSWLFASLQFNVLCISSASITGITYMDNFDFERRYKDINECNPLYWHPLHLPEHCIEIFESAILSRLKSNVPIRLVKEQKGDITEIFSPHGIPSRYSAEVSQAPIRAEISYYERPFRKMLELLSRDVKDHPSAPTVGFLPNVGVVALYQQPISRKSEKMIKTVANAYAADMPYNDPSYFPLYLDTSKTPMKSSEQNGITQLAKTKSKSRSRLRKKKKRN